jgi:transcriptional regulator with XRE-family HTH domain
MHQHHAYWQDTYSYDAEHSNERNCATIGEIMAASPSPTVRRKRLGIELRRLREQADLTCEEVGHRLDCSGTRISRIETGRISIRPGDVRELLEIYGVTGTEADLLVQLAREARQKGWWHTYGPALPPWFGAYVGLEAAAARFRDFQSMVMPGLLQTEDYARAVLRAAPYPGSPDAIDRQVALRMERQRILAQPSPPDVWLVLTESVIRIRVGGPAVMQAQLRHLIEVAERPNVTLQVLPFTTAAHVHPISPFTILEFPDTADPTVVYLEHLTGSLFLEAEDEVSRYTVVFDHLRAEALGTTASLDLIAGVAAELALPDADGGTG